METDAGADEGPAGVDHDDDGLADASDHLTRTAESAAATTRGDPPDGPCIRRDHRAGAARRPEASRPLSPD